MASTVTDPPPANNEFRADTAPLRWMQLKSGAGRIYRHSSGHVLKSQAPSHEFPEGNVEPECQKTKIGGVADSVGPFPSSAPDKHQSCTKSWKSEVDTPETWRNGRVARLNSREDKTLNISNAIFHLPYFKLSKSAIIPNHRFQLGKQYSESPTQYTKRG